MKPFDLKLLDVWVDAQLPPDVADAQEKDASDTLLDALKASLPNFAAGAGSGLASLALLDASRTHASQATEFRRKSHVSGDPRVQGSADTPSGRATLDDLLGKAEWLKKGGRLLVGAGAAAAGVAYGVGYVYDHWDDITDWTGDRVDDVADFATDTWDNATDAVGNAWDSVTPW